MGDPFKKARPGQPLDIPAEAYNAFVDAALAYKRNQLSHTTKGLAPPAPTTKIRNETGQPIPRFGVIGIGEPIILPSANLSAFQNAVALRGTLPQPGKPFAITQEPIPAGACGHCLVHGPTPVRLTIYDADPEAQWAEPTAQNVETLRTYRGGTMRILWREPGDTGTKWAIATNAPNPRPTVRVRLTQTLSKDSGQLIDAELLTMGPDGLYTLPQTSTLIIKVGDLSGLGFSAPAMTKASAELRFGLTINGTFYEVLGILTDVRC